MRLRYLPFFLTFVVLTANAAPDSSLVLPQIQTKESNKDSSKSPAETETVQTTDVSEQAIKRRKLVRVSDASNNFGVGYLSGPMNKDQDTKSLTTFHAQRTQYNLDESAQEFGFMLTSGEFFGVDWGFKKFCCFTSFASAFQPFYKIGFAGIYEPKDELANLIDYKRYFVQASIGSEDLFYSRKALRFETGLRYGYPGLQVFAILFYSFPD